MPWTPDVDVMELPDLEATSPSSDVIEEEEGHIGDLSSVQKPTQAVLNRTAALPHSSPSFDLRKRAATPGELGTPVSAQTKLGDGRLGLSRIPHSTVNHALSLHPTPPARSPSSPRPPSRARSINSSSPTPVDDPNAHLRSPFLAPSSPNSPDGQLTPNLRKPSNTNLRGSAASTKVIDGLQTDLINTRGHLDRVKGEVRSCQRVVATLTRQNEDLKETRERMRMECEGLNNVIARKERLLQGISNLTNSSGDLISDPETMERARTAESSLAAHMSTRKALEQTTKKQVQTMSTQVLEAQAAQAKAERESNSLRDSVKSLRDVWGREIKTVRDEWKRSEEKGKREREEARTKHLALVKLVQAQSADRLAIQTLANTSTEQATAVTAAFESQIVLLREEVDRSTEEGKETKRIAAELATELVRLRRLMREPPRDDLSEAAAVNGKVVISPSSTSIT
ncbi:hypothetical protein P7C73_g619, partial [Tremellales sp. Uapishka_1]